MILSRRIARLVCCCVVVIFVSPAAAQLTPPPAGVFIDAEGVMRSRQVNRSQAFQRRRDARSKSMHYVSLAKLIDEFRSHQRSGAPIPDDIRFLGGIVKLQYVFAYPEENDVVIAGAAEPFSVDEAGRPRGELTGRPVLCLDDFVVAWQALNRRRGGAFGCTIDLPEAGLKRVMQIAQNVRTANRAQIPRLQRMYVEAIGPQPVTVFGMPSDNRLARICVEADYLMKRLSLGVDPSPVRGVKPQGAAKSSNQSVYSRYWFEANYEPLLVSEDGDSYEIRGQGLQVLASRSATDDDEPPTAAARRFSEQMTRHFVELSEHIVPFAELWNATDLAVLAALIQTDRLDQRCEVDVDSLARDFPLLPIDSPKYTDALVVPVKVGRGVSFLIGGVALRPQSVVQEDRETAPAPALQAFARRPVETWLLKQEMEPNRR